MPQINRLAEPDEPLAARLAGRRRRCCVYENTGGGFHLLLDCEAAIWLADLVNAALAAEYSKPRRARR